MENVLKVSVVGEAGVGKSAMIVRLLTGRFLQHYDPTLEDEYYTTSQGEKEIAILDTAGTAFFNAGNIMYLPFLST